MAEFFDSGEIWGLGTGSSVGKLLTASYEPSDGETLVTKGPTDLVCVAEVQGNPCTSVEFEIDVAFEGGEFFPIPSVLDGGASVDIGNREYVMIGDVGSRRVIFRIPWACDVQLKAKATGGGPGNLLRVTGAAADASFSFSLT